MRILYGLLVSLIFATSSSWAASPDELLKAIKSDIAAKRLSSPAGNNALEKIKALREQVPDDFRVVPLAYEWGKANVALAKSAMKKKQFAKAQQYLNVVWSVAYLTPGLEATQDALTKQAKNSRNLNIKSKKEAVAELERQRAMVAQAAKEKARIAKEQKEKIRLAKVKAKKEQQRKTLVVKKSQQKKASKQVASNGAANNKRVAKVPAKNARPQNTARIDQLWKQAVEKRSPVGSYPLSDDKLAGRDRSILSDLKQACQDIVAKKSSIVVEAADKSDYRWLIVRLTLCTRKLDKSFRLRHSYAEADEPKLTLYPPRSSSLLYDAAQ